MTFIHGKTYNARKKNTDIQYESELGRKNLPTFYLSLYKNFSY